MSSADPARVPPRELAPVLGFVALAVLAPIGFTELYPFTRAPMFQDDLRTYCTYDVHAPDGARVDKVALGLHIRYVGNPEYVPAGTDGPQPLHRFGEVPEPGWLMPRIQARLAPGDSVEVEQLVYGALSGGRFGLTDQRRFLVHAP